MLGVIQIHSYLLWYSSALKNIYFIKTRLLLGRKFMTNLDSIFVEGNGNPLQYSCLENTRDGGALWAAVYGVAQSRTRLKWLSSRLVIIFLPRSKRLLISWLQSPSAVILESPKIKSVTVSTVSPSICHQILYKILNDFYHFIFF